MSRNREMFLISLLYFMCNLPASVYVQVKLFRCNCFRSLYKRLHYIKQFFLKQVAALLKFRWIRKQAVRCFQKEGHGNEENEMWLMVSVWAGKGEHGAVVALTPAIQVAFSLLTDVAGPAFKWNAVYSSDLVFLLGLAEGKSGSLFSMTFPAQQFPNHKKKKAFHHVKCLGNNHLSQMRQLNLLRVCSPYGLGVIKCNVWEHNDLFFEVKCVVPEWKLCIKM